MSIPASVMMKLATLGLSAEHAEAVAEMLSAVEAATKEEGSAAIESRRAADRERKARQRHVTSRDITGQDVTSENTPTPFLDKERTKEINPTPAPVCVSSRAREAEFDAVWAIYPHRVGKRDAIKAFAAARQRAPFEAILAGVERYAAKTDDRPWCNPATFFNQDRWEDQPAHPPPPRGGGGGGMSPPRKTGKRNFIDVVRDQEREEANGHESNTGSRGNVELFPPDRSGSRRDDGFTQSGIGRRYGSGHH